PHHSPSAHILALPPDDRHSRRPPLPPSLSSPLRPPPRSPLFPYTTLFRSRHSADRLAATRANDRRRRRCPATALSGTPGRAVARSEEHTSELQSLAYLVCRLLLEKKKGDLRAAVDEPVGSAVEVAVEVRSD